MSFSPQQPVDDAENAEGTEEGKAWNKCWQGVRFTLAHYTIPLLTFF